MEDGQGCGQIDGRVQRASENGYVIQVRSFFLLFRLWAAIALPKFHFKVVTGKKRIIDLGEYKGQCRRLDLRSLDKGSRPLGLRGSQRKASLVNDWGDPVGRPRCVCV